MGVPGSCKLGAVAPTPPAHVPVQLPQMSFVAPLPKITPWLRGWGAYKRCDMHRRKRTISVKLFTKLAFGNLETWPFRLPLELITYWEERRVIVQERWKVNKRVRKGDAQTLGFKIFENTYFTTAKASFLHLPLFFRSIFSLWDQEGVYPNCV